MKTKLPISIKTKIEAEKFLKELHDNGEVFHPEDDAHDISWNGVNVSKKEADQLNKLMKDIYNIPEMSNYPNNKEWDACGFLLKL